MPLPPTSFVGATPHTQRYNIPFAAVGTAGNDLSTELLRVGRYGYLSAARVIAAGTLTGAATNNRTLAVVAVGSRATATDGNIVDPTLLKGLYDAAVAYTAGWSVVYNSNLYVCISAVTGGTGPVADTTHWQPIVQTGLNVVNSVLGVFTADDVGKAISDSGNTNIPASSLIGSVLPSPSGVTVTAAKLVNSSGVAVNGTAVQSRTVTIGSAARTLASTNFASGTNLAADTELDLTLSTTDTRVFPGDVLKLTSTHIGTGLADPGGTLQIEITAYGEGSN